MYVDSKAYQVKKCVSKFQLQSFSKFRGCVTQVLTNDNIFLEEEEEEEEDPHSKLS